MANQIDGIFGAISVGNLEQVRTLIELYVATNDNILEKDYDGNSTLDYASYHKHLEIAKLLIEFEPNLLKEKNDYSGMTALHWASMGGHLEIVKLLVKSAKSGSDIIAIITAVNRNGKTAIDMAVSGNREEIKDFLTEQLEIEQNGGYLFK